MRSRLRLITPAAALACLLVFAATGSSQTGNDAIEGLTVSPPRTRDTAVQKKTYGPISLRNTTPQVFDIRVIPVLIGQDREGGFLVRDDASSKRIAGQLLRPSKRQFVLAPGATDSATGLLKRTTAQDNFYGGLLYEGTPRLGETGSQIEAILRLNGALLLRPPARLQKIKLSAEPVRAEQSGKRIKLLAGIRNDGNTDVTPVGTINVTDSNGAQVAAVNVDRIQILPGSVVDLPALAGPGFPAGVYTLDANLSAGGQVLRASGEMELFATDEVRNEDAKLTKFITDAAYVGEKLALRAEFENTGNVNYAPTARVSATLADGTNGDAGIDPATLEVQPTDPGETGQIAGSIKLPDLSTDYEITLQLLSGERVIASRALTIKPVERPGIITRAGNWITDNAVFLVLFLLVLATTVILILARTVRQARDDG